MLLMIRTYTTIIRTAKMRCRMRTQWILRGFVIISYLFVVLNIICDQYFLRDVLAAALGKKYFIIFEDNLGIDLPMTHRTKTNGIIVVNIVSVIVHAQQVFRGCRIKV